MTREEMKKLLESPIAKAWADGGAIEMISSSTGQWVEPTDDISGRSLIELPDRFRIKPKPREWWQIRSKVGIHADNQTKEAAQASLNAFADKTTLEIVHVREVLE